MDRFLKKATMLFILSFCIGVASLPIVAGMAQSDIGYYGPVDGYSYANSSFILVSSSAYSKANVGPTSGQVPAGQMGVRAYLWRDDVLIDTTSYTYNSSWDDFISKQSPYYSTSGAYHASGRSRAYHGSGYYTYTVFDSPAQNLN